MGDIAEEKRIFSYEELCTKVQEIYTQRGNPATFDTPYKAHKLCTLIPRHKDFIYYVTLERGAPETFWMIREALRFSALFDHVHTPVVIPQNTALDRKLHDFLNMKWEHFIHVSKDEPLYIAYTPDENYGKRDRRVKTTVGRYLKKFHGDQLSDADIRAMADVYRYYFGVDDIEFARTQDEIIATYTNGPHSCMAYAWSANSDHYGSQMHPAAAYEAPGLAVAYTKREGRINARCLVYENPNDPSDKRYIRNYGDEVLTRKLESAGYKFGTLEGVRLKKIPAVTKDGEELPETYVCPYIDDVMSSGDRAQAVVVEDDALVVVKTNKRGAYGATNTAGLVGYNRTYQLYNHDSYRIIEADGVTQRLSPRERREARTCSCCGKPARSSEAATSKVHDLETICPACQKNFTRAVTAQGVDYVRLENAIELYKSGYVLNDPSVFEQLNIVALDVETYGENVMAWAESTRLHLGKRVHIEDLAELPTCGGIELKKFIKSTYRKVLLGRNAPTKDIRIDLKNGWIRSTTIEECPLLSDVLIEMCATTAPEHRLDTLRAHLHGENTGIVERVYSWLPELLTKHGHSDLINEAKQGELLVEED